MPAPKDAGFTLLTIRFDVYGDGGNVDIDSAGATAIAAQEPEHADDEDGNKNDAADHSSAATAGFNDCFAISHNELLCLMAAQRAPDRRGSCIGPWSPLLTDQTSVAINLGGKAALSRCRKWVWKLKMIKSATVPAEQSETALEAADRLVRYASELLELANDIHHELELAGEIPDALVKRLRSAMVEERKALQALLGSVQV